RLIFAASDERFQLFIVELIQLSVIRGQAFQGFCAQGEYRWPLPNIIFPGVSRHKKTDRRAGEVLTSSANL
ncbi:hypothetical protein, partial [Pseudomonas viridiflava]|uniref:hypothetical protein n=1 Tax=Pseudomonas viridiflava TaxID=33069 RepID=UPI0019D1A24C